MSDLRRPFPLACAENAEQYKSTSFDQASNYDSNLSEQMMQIG